jgi:hypothetical protein
MVLYQRTMYRRSSYSTLSILMHGYVNTRLYQHMFRLWLYYINAELSDRAGWAMWAYKQRSIAKRASYMKYRIFFCVGI